MHETHAPLLVPVTENASLPGLLVRNVARAPQAAGYAVQRDGAWQDITHTQFLTEVETLAKGLMAAGIAAGDRVAIMSRTRYEWTLVDFALMSAGAVPVPVYETSAPDQIEWILRDAHAVGIVVEDETMARAVSSVRDACPHLRDVWRIDAGQLDELCAGADEISDAELRARRDALTADSIATVIYTSGTTGRPKGCVLTHGNFVALSDNALAQMHELVDGDDNRGTLLFLPLAHVFARLIQFVAIDAGVRLGHAPTITTLVDDLQTFRPSFLLAVPRVFEKVYNSAEQGAQKDGRGKVFTAAAEVAVAYSTARQAGGRISPVLRAKHAVFDRLVYRKLRAAFGGEVRYSISGGAPLGTRLAHFYNGVGLPVLEGWGLTETTAPATVNPPSRMKIGTVGPACPGVDLRIAEDGEILVRGINVFREYLGNPQATEEAKPDGWFRTGDLGQLDNDGYLTITGRKKDLLITAGGKNVNPSKLEDILRSHTLVAEAVVVGDGRPFIAALMTLDEEMLPGWLTARGLAPISLHEAAHNPAVLAALQEAVDAANATVSRAESIRKFVVLPGHLTEESGHLTPSLKIKRHVVLEDFRDRIDELYTQR